MSGAAGREESLPQVARFIIFSGLAALTNIASRYGFSVWLAVNYTLAIVLAHTLAMGVSYTLNRNLNFPRGPRNPFQEMRTYLVVNLSGLLLTTGLSHLFLLLLSAWLVEISTRTQLETVSHITAVGLTGIYSFFGHKYFTYQYGLRKGTRHLWQKFFPPTSSPGSGPDS